MFHVRLTQDEYDALSIKSNSTIYVITKTGKAYRGATELKNTFKPAATALDYITITTPPTKVNYNIGEALDYTGIEVTATYVDLHTEVVTSLCTFSLAEGTLIRSTTTSFNVTLEHSTVTLNLNVFVDYLCLTANAINSIISLSQVGTALTAKNIEKSYNGSTWESYVLDEDITLENINDKVYFRGKNATLGESSEIYNLIITTSGNVAVSGDVKTLLDYDVVITSIPNYCYKSFFEDADITTAPPLYAITVGQHSYESMFKNCINMGECPALPATTIGNYCYASMFEGCNTIVETAVLPATTMGQYCYYNMYKDCISLETINVIGANTSAVSCFSNMFENCQSLTNIVELNTTTTALNCCYQMFMGCSLLRTLPKLNSTTLADGCYYEMFKNCTSLKLTTAPNQLYKYKFRIPTIGIGTEGINSITNMFANTGGSLQGTPRINVTYYTEIIPV